MGTIFGNHVTVSVKEMSLKMKLVFESTIAGKPQPDKSYTKEFKALPGETAPEFLKRVSDELSDRGLA